MKLATKYSKESSSAVVVDGKLILSLPDAILPVVWQMDLDQAKSSALEVHESGGNFPLVLKTTKNEAVEIAKFNHRDSAVKALMAASRALEKAHGQIRTGGQPGTSPVHISKASPSRPWLAFLLGILMLFVLLNVWGYMSSKSMAPAPIGTTQTGAAPTTGGNDGVPLSADEYLKRN